MTIKLQPILRIRSKFERIPKDVLAKLTSPTVHIADAMGGRAGLDPRIQALSGTPKRICGSALTVDAGPGDCLAVIAALRVAKPDDVLVVTTHQYKEAAVVGDVLLAVAKELGVKGLVTDGLVRDLPGIQSLAMPCFAAGTTPNSAHRTGPGSVGLPISIGTRRIEAGDLIIGDEDGVVTVAAGDVPNLLSRLTSIRDAEKWISDELEKTTGIPGFLDDALNVEIEFID